MAWLSRVGPVYVGALLALVTVAWLLGLGRALLIGPRHLVRGVFACRAGCRCSRCRGATA